MTLHPHLPMIIDSLASGTDLPQAMPNDSSTLAANPAGWNGQHLKSRADRNPAKSNLKAIVLGDECRHAWDLCLLLRRGGGKPMNCAVCNLQVGAIQEGSTAVGAPQRASKTRECNDFGKHAHTFRFCSKHVCTLKATEGNSGSPNLECVG